MRGLTTDTTVLRPLTKVVLLVRGDYCNSQVVTASLTHTATALQVLSYYIPIPHGP